MRTLTQLFLAAAMFTAATADAKPRKVVVVEFDGLPRNLAETGRTNVMALLGDQYDLVPTKKWESARAQAPGRGPQQWSQAAKTSGVDAVIEGWVNTEGRHHTLTVQVRDAATGNEIDVVSINIGDKGLNAEGQKSLSTQLDDVLNWIDADATSNDVHSKLDDITTKPKLGAHVFNSKKDDDDYDDRSDRDDRDDRDDRRDHRSSRPKKKSHVTNERDDRDDRDRDRPMRMRDRDDRDDRDDDRDSKHRSRRDDDRRDNRRSSTDDDTRDVRDDAAPSVNRAAPGLKVAALDPQGQKDTNDLLTFFPTDSKEADVVAEAKAPRIMKPAPKYFLEGGAFVSSRGMSFVHNPPDSQQAAPDYPAAGLAGIAVQGAVYPYPINKLDYDPSGIGFSFGIQKSVGSILSAYDPVENTYGDYTVDHTAYEGAIHYRIPTDIIAFDADASYGKFGYALGIPDGTGIQIPDVNYTYLGIGGTLDLKVTDRTRCGFGAHYMYLLDAGDVSDERWYGSGSASGIDLEAHFQIPINDLLFVRGQLDYRRVSMDFEQSGDFAVDLEIGSITDSTIGGTALIGVQF